jgi:hypothetical protein
LARINPFKPFSPAPPGVFAGRLKELLRLEAHLLQTRAGQPTNFTITGERGIGKSSLLLYVKYLAIGDLTFSHDQLRFLVVDTDISASTSQLTLTKKIQLGIDRELGRREPLRKFASEAWAFIQRIKAGGVSLKSASASEPDETFFEEFADSLARVANRVCHAGDGASTDDAPYDGILILIDEADNAPPDLALGSFLKLLMERLQRRGCNKVMIGLAGLPSLRTVLSQSHPSAPRLFDEVRLERLGSQDISKVIDQCLGIARDRHGQTIEITAKARSHLISLSEGYPHFIQQFGYSAFAHDTDGAIDENDVLHGAFEKGGALHSIGDRYYRDDFYGKIQKESYRQVLRIMADNLDGWVKKAEIRKRFRGSDSQLNNALHALRDRKIILSKEGTRGVYRLQHKGFALWIKLFTVDPSELQRSLESEWKDA